MFQKETTASKFSKSHDILIQGLPEHIPERLAAVCRTKLIGAVSDLLDKTKLARISLTVGTADTFESHSNKKGGAEYELSVEQRALRYQSGSPLYHFDYLIVPDTVKDAILAAVSLIQLEQKVFDEWGLRKIEPFPRTVLNFHGPSGTGKTLAAHALASHLGRMILSTSYADIESMYHGEAPKNVEAIFFAAQRDNAVLFIDEADSLLSKRLTTVTQGSEQAINSMRSQLLISLEKFNGMVIFATNLVSNYDKAFETRVRNVHFPLPDESCREKIWQVHLPDELPCADDVSVQALAVVEDICGRDIKNAVIDAALRCAADGAPHIELENFINSIKLIKESRISSDSSRTSELIDPVQVETEIKKATQTQETTP